MALSAAEIKAQFAAKRTQGPPASALTANGSQESFHVEQAATPPPAQPMDRIRETTRKAKALMDRPRQGEQLGITQADQVELATIAALYLYPNRCFPVFAERALPDFFADPIYRRFFDILRAYHDEHGHADPNAFLQHLIDLGQLENFGGPAFVSRLLNQNSPPAAFEYHIDILRDKYVAREAVKRSTELSRKVSSAQGEELWTAISEHEAAMVGLRSLAADKLTGVEDFKYADLVGFDATKDPTVLLGTRRWLGQGYTCLWAGGSGYGKSTLQMQAALYWATGTPFFGIPAVRPLKSLIIQAENDLGDTSEQFQGVISGIKNSGDVQLNGAVERMIVIVRLIGATGDKFLATLASLLKLYTPELVWIDPLFAFAGCDLIDTAAVSKFLREGLIPIVVDHGVCAHVIHHIAKPARDNDAKKTWASHDYQFLGFGSSEIQNAFRAVNVLIPVAGHEGVFKLVLSKRGSRAGAKAVDGEFSNALFLSHAKDGSMTWSQVDEPVDQSKSKAGQFEAKFTADNILEQMDIGTTYQVKELQKLLASEQGMSRMTFYRHWTALKEGQKVRIDQDGLWQRK